VLHGAPSGTIHDLQRVQNNAARIVVQAPKRSHAKPLLQELHWLPVEAAHHVQAGRAAFQDSTHVNAGVPESTHRGT